MLRFLALGLLAIWFFATSMATATTEMVFFREGKGMFLINSDGTGLKLLDGDGESEAIWLSASEVCYKKQMNLWRINVRTGRADKLTIEGRMKPGSEDSDEFGGFTDVDSPVFNQERQELYYRVIDGDTFGSVWRLVDLKTKERRNMPAAANFSTIYDARGSLLVGEVDVMPSKLMIFDWDQNEATLLTKVVSKWGDGQPRISPDGQMLAFTRNMAIWTYDLAKNTTKFLYEEAQMPMWSPDGKKLFCEHQAITAIPGYQFKQIILLDLEGNSEVLVQGCDYERGSEFLDPCGWTKDGQIVWEHSYFIGQGENSWSRDDIKLIDPKTGAKSIVIKNGSKPSPCPF